MSKAIGEVAKEAPQNLTPNLSKKAPLDLRNQRAKDNEKVQGIFRYHEVPGGGVSFCYKFYKEDPVERYDLVDGNLYTLPLGVARHLNKNGWYPVYEFMKDEATQNVQRVGQKVRRFSFQSTEFVDLEDLTPVGKIITVENAG